MNKSLNILPHPPVSQSQYIAHHGHDGQRTSVVGTAIKPHLRTKKKASLYNVVCDHLIHVSRSPSIVQPG